MLLKRLKGRLRTSTCRKSSEAAKITVVNLEKHYSISEAVCMKMLCLTRVKAYQNYKTRSHKHYSQLTMKMVAYQVEMKESKLILKLQIKQRKCLMRQRKSFKCQSSAELQKNHLSVVSLEYLAKTLSSSNKSMPKMKTKIHI